MKISYNFISFHLFADNIALYKAGIGCRSPQGNNLLRVAILYPFSIFNL